MKLKRRLAYGKLNGKLNCRTRKEIFVLAQPVFFNGPGDEHIGNAGG